MTYIKAFTFATVQAMYSLSAAFRVTELTKQMFAAPYICSGNNNTEPGPFRLLFNSTLIDSTLMDCNLP